MKIDTDKSYLLGLLVGGGILSDSGFQILLPYKNWGKIDENPVRAGQIATDILKRLSPKWKAAYDIDVSFKIGNDWKIVSNGISKKLKEDLELTNLPTKGELRSIASLNGLLPFLKTFEHKKAFVTGLVDTIGSLAATHRKFNDEFQIISFEFKGNNFDLVKDVLDLFESAGFPPDQVLWNHPNQHSGTCRYYKSWKKGFKIRIPLDDYMLQGGFVFESKKLSAQQNLDKSKTRKTALNKDVKIQGRVTLHKDEDSQWLPSNIRGGHFVHYLQFFDVFGLKTPQSFDRDDLMNNFHKYFCPFTCLTKGSLEYITDIIKNESYLNLTKFSQSNITCSTLLGRYAIEPGALILGKSPQDGFPINMVLQAIAYVVAAETGQVRGKRVQGKYADLLKKYNDAYINSNLGVSILRPDRGTCLLVKNKNYAALVGYVNEGFNKTLIVSKESLKIVVREPVFEECIPL